MKQTLVTTLIPVLLPFPDRNRSAEVLVESEREITLRAVLYVLDRAWKRDDGGNPVARRNIRMWAATLPFLVGYGEALLAALTPPNKHYKGAIQGALAEFSERLDYLPKTTPDWWDGDVHFSHKVFLCQTDWETYSRRFPEVMDTDVGTYFEVLWPGSSVAVTPTDSFVRRVVDEEKPKSESDLMLDYVKAKTGIDVQERLDLEEVMQRGLKTNKSYAEHMEEVMRNLYNQERLREQGVARSPSPRTLQDLFAAQEAKEANRQSMLNWANQANQIAPKPFNFRPQKGGTIFNSNETFTQRVTRTIKKDRDGDDV